MASAFHSQPPFAAERYVLNELSEEEKLSFEEHFFSCEACAREVEDLTTIRLASPGELRKMDRKPQWSLRTFIPWVLSNQFAFGALGVLLMIAGYQNFFQIPHLRAEADDAFAVSPAPRALSVTRSGESNVVDAKLRSASFLVANEWSRNYPGYRVELFRQGSPKGVFQKDLAGASDSLLVTLPASRLGAGQFDLVVSGKPVQSSPEIVGRYVVTVKESYDK